MSAGDYSATIAITAPGVWNSPQMVPVNLHVVSRITVSIDAPDEVGAGSDFVARVNVTEVADFDSFQLKVSYDNSVIQITGEEGGEGVTPGQIDSTSVPIDMWVFSPEGTPGTAFVLGNLPGVAGVNGTGYLCEVHFTVVGDPGDSNDITLSEGWLGDVNGLEILVGQWLGTTVQVTLFDAEFSTDSGIVGHALDGTAGVTEFDFTDATTGGTMPYTYEWDFENDTVTDSTLENPSHIYPAVGNYTVVLTVSDSLLDGDTETKIEYIIVRQPGDANQDGAVDIGDVTKVERVILGLDAPKLFADADQEGIINR